MNANEFAIFAALNNFKCDLIELVLAPFESDHFGNRKIHL